ncbi:uncharacterized protein LOC143920978 [Arctopsyche grandis]|uniref:uncharacterized protein LOC143920978 n=1 Tax=Arctopsyche grandis TaxID=121162 RepID=UPI00406D6320
MFNLSTTGNVGYNGISQLSESRCTTQYNNTIERTTPTATPGTKMRYTNTGARTKYSNSFKMPLYSEVKNASSDSRLKLSTAKEDVYTFNDADTPVITSRTPNSFLKESTTPNKTDCIKKSLSGSLLTSPKKVHIAKQVNGFGFRKDVNVPESKNGFYKSNVNSGDTSAKIQNSVLPPQRITVKPNKDLFESLPFLSDVKTEPDPTAFKLNADGLNHSTKNSITSYNVKPAKLVMISQDRKSLDFSNKKESGLRGSNGSFNPTLPSSSFKSNIKIPTKKIPSGKPLPTLSKVRRGRGPALHEALQRINSSPLSNFHSRSSSSTDTWHAPGTDLFDCGALDSSYTRVDSDSSDDYPSDCVEEGDSDISIETDDRSEKIVATRTSLRRKLNLLHQLEKISKYSESASKLYNSVKTQFKQKKKRTKSGEGFRLESPALDMLLASQGTTSILSTADRRKIKSGGRLVEPVQCARIGCGAPALACARLCVAHISLNPEQRLFAECTAKFSDNTQCRVPVVDVRNELPLCSEHTLKKDNYIKNVQESKPRRAPRKRPKSSSIRPSKRNHKKKSTTSSNDSKSETGGKYLLTDDSELFTSTNIENGIASGFLNHEDTTELNVCSNSSICESSEDTGIGGLSENELMVSSNHNQHLDPDVVAEVLAMHESEDLPSLVLPVTCPPQEPNIDLSTVFNDFFTEQNGEYIPTREETEELERALEAVNQDVKSLEKLTNSEHSSLLLDTLLDERTLAETFASFPDVFSNIPPLKVVTAESVIDPTSSSS